MVSGGPWLPAWVPAIRDDAYTARKHTRSGQEVLRELAKGMEAHVFDDGVDLRVLEYKVWTEGTYQGQVGAGQRGHFQRFVWRSPVPIGTRMQAGKPDQPLYWVEIKGRMYKGKWVYHMDPRSKPASP